MTIKKITASAIALSLAAVPTLASAAPVQANPASSLSVAGNVRAGTPAKGKSHFTQSGAIIAGVLALGVVAGGIIAVSKSDDRPASR